MILIAIVVGLIGLVLFLLKRRNSTPQAARKVEYEVKIQGEGEKKAYIVTGGGGMVGTKVLRNLKAEYPGAKVIALDLMVPTKPSKLADGCTYIRCDLSNKEHLKQAFDEAKKGGCTVEAVLHIAAVMPAITSTRPLFERVNINGTKTLVEASIENDVKGFVYCSSGTVVLDMVRGNHEGVKGEDLPYPKEFVDDYAWSKAGGEQIVTKANGKKLPGGGQMTTISIRISGIVDAVDRALGQKLPRGYANVYFGSGDNCLDMVWAYDVARAHVNAVKAVADKSEAVGGNCYHIGGLTERLTMKGWVNYPDPNNPEMSLWGNRIDNAKSVPKFAGRLGGYINQLAFHTTGTMPLGILVRPDTVRVSDGTVSWYFDLSKTKQDLDWEPTPVPDVIRAISTENRAKRDSSFMGR